MPGGYAFEWLKPMLKVANQHMNSSRENSPVRGHTLLQCEHIKAANEWARCCEEIMSALAHHQ
jgi:hypothetical protein